MARTWVRRAAITTVTAATMVGLAAAPALAHECYKTNRNAQSTTGAMQSQNWFTISDLMLMFGFDEFQSEAAQAGWTITWHGNPTDAAAFYQSATQERLGWTNDYPLLVNAHGLMAGGVDAQREGAIGQGKTQGSPPVDYIFPTIIDVVMGDCMTGASGFCTATQSS